MAETGDDDKTVIPARGSRWVSAPAAPTEPEDSDEHNALPVGGQVGEFEIKSIIGIGGFGIVYLAHDTSLGRNVALKEYLPTSLAFRKGQNVTVKTARHADTFAAGLASFINEARVLAQFDNPSLVKVYRFWSANGTAYMVMPFYDGPTLKQALQDAAEPPNEQWLKALLVPLLSALQLLHGENYFHRDIAPDNILLDKGKRPILLDFGAARRVIAGSNKALTVILKPGFAPIEQYSDTDDMAQGAWTDIYALAAVIHYAMTGKAPTPSVSRLMKDTAVPLAQAASGRYSDGFLRAIDRALSVRPEDRPQTIDDFRLSLGLGGVAVDDLPHARPAPADPGSRPGRKLLALGGVAAVVVAAAAAVLLMRKGEPPPAPGPVASAAGQQPRAVPAAPPAASPVAATAPAAAGAQVETPPPAASPAPSPAADASRTFHPADALAQLYDLRDAGHPVAVTLDKTTVRIGKDKLRFRIQSPQPGYVYIFMLGTDKQHISLLFPNALDQKNQARGSEPVNLPRAGWAMTAGGPPGTNEFVAIVSQHPHDFSKIGLTRNGPFSEFPPRRVAAQFGAAPGASPVLAGTPICSVSNECSGTYGAARFVIEEIR